MDAILMIYFIGYVVSVMEGLQGFVEKYPQLKSAMQVAMCSAALGGVLQSCGDTAGGDVGYDVVESGDAVSTLLVDNGFVPHKDNIRRLQDRNDLDDEMTIYPGDTIYFPDALEELGGSPVDEAHDPLMQQPDIGSESVDHDHESQETDLAIEEFGEYIALNKHLQKLSVDKHTDFGQWIRSIRFYDDMRDAVADYASSFDVDYVIALRMQEGRGNTASINAADGGNGIFHWQPDVAKKEANMKIFTDDAKYHAYDFDRLRDRGRSRASIYKKHGELLQQIVDESDGYERLATLDDRRDLKKCTNATAAKLQDNYVFAESFLKKKNLSSDLTQRIARYRKYADNHDVDFLQLCALNGFNKGRGSFLADFDGTTNKTGSGNHIPHIVKKIANVKRYNAIVRRGIDEGLSDNELWEYLLDSVHVSYTK